MTKGSRGFSLVELLIVVAIILIVAAIAIPNLLRSRIAANQASSVGSLRTLNTAEIIYSSTYNVGFSATMAYLAPPAATGASPSSTAAGLIDSVLAAGSKSGYSFAYSAGPTDSSGHINTYEFNAAPLTASTGRNYYRTDQSGVIRHNSTTAAASTDSPIAGELFQKQ